MKKLVVILMVVLMASFAFGREGWSNVFKGDFADEVNAYMRIPAWDENADSKEQIPLQMLGFAVSLDTLNVKVADASDLGKSGTKNISLKSGEVLILSLIYVESGFDSSDYLEISNYDSNGAVLDTFNLISDGFRTNKFYFSATQDTNLIFVLGDTVNVDKKIIVEELIIKR